SPRLSATMFRASAWAAQFQANEQIARAMVDAGRGDDLFPMTFPAGGPSWISAATYLDKYCGDQYDPLAWGGQIRVPVLRVDPDGDLAPGTLNGMLMGGLAEALLQILPPHDRNRAVVIANADHAYTTGQSEFIATIRSWLIE
ncbi:MAG: hypothetical protein NZ518_03710, partial [Dehalococcoidia bacterium]|nr:hypothetical protein [Dehalococcoidia bacterium]